MQLTVKVHAVYGKEYIYPACEVSILLAQLLKQKSFTDRDMEILKEIGFTFATEPKTL